MKKTILAIVAILIIGGGAYYWLKQKPIVTKINNENNPIKVVENWIDAKKQPTYNPSDPLGIPTGNNLTKYSIPNTNITVEFPNSYEMRKSTDNNGWWFAGFDFSKANGLGGMDFETKESIQKFEANISKDDPYMYPYTTIEIFNAEKKSIEENRDYNGYKIREFNNRLFLTKNGKVDGDEGYSRTYITFIGDIRISSSVWMKDLSQTDIADKEFSNIKFITEKSTN